jgi:acyl-CoA thioesterase-1
MPVEKGWVSLIQKRLPPQTRVIDAAESGKTTSGALRILPGLLDQHRPQVVILEIGANDGLRGHHPDVIKRNLASMITQSMQSGAHVLMTGMDIPSNYGPVYREAFRSVYTDLAADYDIAFVPSIFDEIFLRPDLLQADGLHPNEAAQHVIADRILPVLKTLID